MAFEINLIKSNYAWLGKKMSAYQENFDLKKKLSTYLSIFFPNVLSSKLLADFNYCTKDDKFENWKIQAIYWTNNQKRKLLTDLSIFVPNVLSSNLSADFKYCTKGR